MTPELIVIGGGLAGTEAAWQAAERGIDVTLYEMRPQRNTPAHTTDQLAELICSNSLGSNLPDRASGLLKAELRLLNSLIMRVADETAVPAGGALAVDRDRFAQLITERIVQHPRIELRREEVKAIPAGAVHHRQRAVDGRRSGERHRAVDRAAAPVLLRRHRAHRRSRTRST